MLSGRILVLSKSKRRDLAAVWEHSVFPVTPCAAHCSCLVLVSALCLFSPVSWPRLVMLLPVILPWPQNQHLRAIPLYKGMLPLLFCPPSVPQAQRNSNSPKGSTPSLLPQRLLRLIFSVHNLHKLLLIPHPEWGLVVVMMGDSCQCSLRLIG